MVRNLAIGLIIVAACGGSARIVRKTQTGGVLELEGDTSKAMEAADQEMASHCGQRNYTIVQEGKEPIESPDPAQPAAKETGTRVHYQCNGAGAPPAVSN
jgi:hypothetical protein